MCASRFPSRLVIAGGGLGGGGGDGGGGGGRLPRRVTLSHVTMSEDMRDACNVLSANNII